MRRYQLELIKYTLLGVNLLTCMFVSMTVYLTTCCICADYEARTFLQNIAAIPRDPTMLVIEVLALLLATDYFPVGARQVQRFPPHGCAGNRDV